MFGAIAFRTIGRRSRGPRTAEAVTQFGVAASILDLVGVVFFGEFQCSNVQGGHWDRRLSNCGRLEPQRPEAIAPRNAPRLRYFGRDTRGAGVKFGANMMSYQSNGAFPVGSRQTLAGVHQAARKPIDPQPAVRVEHYL